MFKDSYKISWELYDEETGDFWVENYDNMSLSDFEVLYGNNTYVITKVRIDLIQ